MVTGQVFKNQKGALRFLILILILAMGPGMEFGESGFKYFRNYSNKEYDHHPQNWCITQNEEGIVFVGNIGGVLEYDGVSWRLIWIPNMSAWALTIDASGTVFVGGKSELGFLTPDAAGNLQYQSLLDRLKTIYRDFGNIMQTIASADGVYFITSKYLFRWSSGEFKIWESHTGFLSAHLLGEKLYVQENETGLQVLENDSFHDIPGGSFFNDEMKRIIMIEPVDAEGRTFLIGTKSNGLFFYNRTHFTPFPTPADDLLKQRSLLHGISLTSGDYALATDGAGVIVIDLRGKIKHRFDTSYGLPDNNVKYLYREPGGNLWIALNNGLSRIEYESPFVTYDQRSRLPGAVLSMVKHVPSDTYYIGTTEGLFKFLPSTGSIEHIRSISKKCLSLVSHNDSIIAATNQGMHDIRNNTLLRIDERKAACLLASRNAPDLVWAGTSESLTSYQKNNSSGLWETKSINLPIKEYIFSISEEPDGTLWLGTKTSGVFSISSPGADDPHITQYDKTKSEGLPVEKDNTMGEIHVARIANHTVFATQHGLYFFDRAKGMFVPDPLLGEKYTGNPAAGEPIFRIAEDSDGNIWFHSRSRNYAALLQPDGTYRIENTAFLRIPILQVNSIYPEPDVVWFCTYESLIKYDKQHEVIRSKETRPFLNLIRRVERINDKTPLFAGHHVNQENRPVSPPVLPYKDRNLRFFFAAPFFQEESATRYSYFLDDYDEEWSPWSSETRKDYTNLGPGDYTFFVKAKNVYEQASIPASFSFKVLAPWYLSLPFIIAYIILFGLMLYSGFKFRYRHLTKEKERLEAIVEERTRLLTLQSQKLKEMDEAKSRFFTAISHEFRTPLTLIMGPLEQILSASPTPELKNKGQLMLRNAQRLLGLINQLLDLSRLRSGKMRLQVTRKNIIPFLRGIISSFQLIAEQQKIQLAFRPQQDDITLYFNSENVEQILCNLLSNSVKNTLPGGSITVSASITRLQQKAETFPDGFLEISVSDTGIGIPADQLPHIFELFYQARTPYEHKSKGSGIGLSLARELVELHYGDIQVQSTEGKGTDFFFYLPLGKNHLKPEEIVDVTLRTIERPKDTACMPAEESPVPEHHESDETAGDAVKPIILVVDDDADLRGYLCSAFDSFYVVIEAVDGEDGWEKAAGSIPDLVIADVIMPRMDGFELTRRIKRDPRTCHIPVILLTANTSRERMLEGFETGADDYIPKPFSLELLAARVKNLIELRRQLQERMKDRMALKPHEISVSPIDEEFYTELRQTVEKNLSDPGFNVEGLSEKLMMGRTTVYRKILALTGETPNQFIRSYRLRRAAQLLKAHAGTVSEISSMVGFPNPSYFAHCFKEEFFISPSDTLEENTKGIPVDGTGGANLQESPPVVDGNDSIEPGFRDRELVLIVEDNPDMCDFIRGALETHYSVETASDGPGGFDGARELIPDLVISDIMMPGFDGLELCRRLKSDISTSHIPIVMLTARASEKDILKGLEHGVDDYITKPFNTDILLARIRGILRLRSHLQAKRKRQLRLEPDEIAVSSMDEKFLKDVNRCIEKNLSDFDFNVEVLADKLSIGRTTLYRKVLALTGENPTHYIRSFRLNKAAHILKTGNGSITDVAFDVGFSSSPYFTRCFKEMFHRLPSGFREVESNEEHS